MSDTTTVRVSMETRNEIRALAKADGLTIDETLHKLARAERQRRMGEALGVSHTNSTDQHIFNAYAATIADHGSW